MIKKILKLVTPIFSAIIGLLVANKFNVFEFMTFVPEDYKYEVCITTYTEWVNIIITNTPHKNNYGLLNYLSVATSLTLIEGTIKAADNML